MFDKFKELVRQKFSPIHLNPGDSLTITYRDPDTEQVLCEKKFDAEYTPMTITEAVIFEAVYEGRRAIGGMVLEAEK